MRPNQWVLAANPETGWHMREVPKSVCNSFRSLDTVQQKQSLYLLFVCFMHLPAFKVHIKDPNQGSPTLFKGLRAGLQTWLSHRALAVPAEDSGLVQRPHSSSQLCNSLLASASTRHAYGVHALTQAKPIYIK